MRQIPPTQVHDDPILTTRAVAELLGVSVSTAQQWIENGAIASWKTPGGHRRVRRSSVMALMQETSHSQTCAVDSFRHDGLDEAEFLLPADPDYPVSANESERLRALAASKLIDSPPEHAFDRLTWLASRIIGAPMAIVSLVTARRQWFKSKVGLDVAETPRAWAFCGHTILSTEPLIIADARMDERFAQNPLVTGQPFIRFYAGFPLVDQQGYRLGTLCVLDRQPRMLDEDQRRAMTELAAIASEAIVGRSQVTV